MEDKNLKGKDGKDVEISQSTHQLLMKEAKRYKISMKNYTESAIKFFALRGQNPLTFEQSIEANLVKEIRDLGNRIFSFLKVEEENLLIPLVKEVMKNKFFLEIVRRNMYEVMYKNPDQIIQKNNEDEDWFKEKLEKVFGKSLNEIASLEEKKIIKRLEIMHTKLINPSKNGKKVYDNKGSCGALVNYLNHEKKEQGEEVIFFNSDRDNISKQEAIAMIDTNVKGLKDSETKFYSIVISPSKEELEHIRDNKDALKEYAKEAMKNYADNFNLPNGKKLDEKDFVWFATIHEDRKYTGLDEENSLLIVDKKQAGLDKKEVEDYFQKQAGLDKKEAKDLVKQFWEKGVVKQGEPKEGLNAHIHITVSRRDKEQKLSLTPNANRKRFCLRDWQISNGKSFQKMFSYEKETILNNARAHKNVEKNYERIEKKVEFINGFLPKDGKLDLNRVKDIAQQQDFSKGFYLNLYKLENKIKEGNSIKDPYHFLENGKDIKVKEVNIDAKISGYFQKLQQLVNSNLYSQDGYTESLSKGKSKGKAKSRDMEIEM